MSLLALAVLAALVGGMIRTGAQSASYWRSVDRSYVADAVPLVAQSNHLGNRVGTVLSHLATETRVDAEVALASLERTGDRLAQQAATLSHPSVSGGAGTRVATAMSDRARAIRALKNAVDGLLGAAVGPGGSTAATGTTRAARSLATSGSLVVAGDRAYASAQRALRAAPGHASLPASVWRRRTRALTAAGAPSLVRALTGSASLAPVHDVVLASGALALTPAPVPPAGQAAAGTVVVPPTSSITLRAIVANRGNVDERGVDLRATLRSSGATHAPGPSLRSRSFAVAAHSSVAVTMPRLHVVPGSSYTLTVRVDPPSPDVAGARTSGALTFTVAPPSPPVISQIAPSHGRAAGGNDVTILGSGFEWVRAVKFGSAAARYKVVSGTQITAVAPRGSGKVTVEVVNTGGASAPVTADRYSYHHR